MFNFDDDEEGATRAREICARWGFPVDGGPEAAMQAVDAIKRADAELDILFPEQRERFAAIEREAEPGQEHKEGAFVFGLAMQCMMAAMTDGTKAGAVT